MYLTLDENQRMARAAAADSMHAHSRSSPIDRRRVSINGVFSGSSSRHAAPSRPDPSSLATVVYWPNRSVSNDEGPASLDANAMTHLIYTAATVDHDGTVRLSDESPNFGTDPSGYQSSLEACLALKIQNPNLKVLASVGGEGSGHHCLSFVAANDRLSRAFGKAARSFAAKYDLDGIELDWSSASTEEEAERFLKLTATTEGYLGEDLDKRWYRLCIALPGPLLPHVNLKEAHKLVDFIIVRTFNFSSPTAAKSLYHSQIYSANLPSCVNTINILESRGANMRKVLLGIPCFGRAYVGASAPNQPFRESSEVPYKMLPLLNAPEYTDEQCGSAYCIGEASDIGYNERPLPIFISYDNPFTVTMKVQLVKDRRLGGLCFCTGAGDKTGEKSLIRTGFVGLGGTANSR